MVNTAYGTAGQNTAGRAPAASPWAAVGVSAFEERVYQAILHQPDAGAAGWALLTGASPTQVREACNQLLGLGLLQPPDSMGGLRAVDPRVAVRGLIRRRETEFRTARRHRRGDGHRVRGRAAAGGTVPADRGRLRRGRHRGTSGGDVRTRRA
ncbi:hypothetical protein ACRJ4W_29795 [Streptomyces sp. GLT-R25]